MFLSFVWEGSIFPGPELDYVLGEYVGESCVVHGAHLLGLQNYAGSFAIGQWGEMAGGFSQGRHLQGLGLAQRSIGRLSHGLGVHYIAGLCSI
jgi:hypothetical protein